MNADSISSIVTHISAESSHDDVSLEPVAQATPATNRRWSERLPPVPGTTLAIAVKPSEEMDSAGIDSGYASLSVTPESKSSKNAQDCIAGNIIQLPHRNIFRKKAPILRQFDKQIPRETQQRFDDLGELFGKPLYDYLAKARLRYNSISMKLKVLGQSEDTARPWIVVLCSTTILKKVKQIFQQKWVKDEYRPKSPESDLLYFDIVYDDRATRQYAASAHPDVRKDPLASMDDAYTLCGVTVRVDRPCGHRSATLGGTIKVVTSEGAQELYGMTVSHIVTGGTVNEDEANAIEYSSEEEDEDRSMTEDGEDSAFEEEYQLGSDLEDDDDGNEARSTLRGYAAQGPWPKLGHIHAASGQTEEDAHDLDWALVTLDEPVNYLHNILTDSAGTHSLWNSEHVEDKLAPTSCVEVVLLNDARDPRPGRLLPSKSFIMLAQGRGFVQVYNMNLIDGSGESRHETQK